MKIENGKYNFELINQSKELKAQCLEFPKYKKDFEEKIVRYESAYEHTIKTFDEIRKDFDDYKSKFTDLSEFIKVILN